VATLKIKNPNKIASDFFILYLPMFTVRFTSSHNGPYTPRRL
jgi:hypothetical protein